MNRRRILSLWFPRLPTDRIKRQHLQGGWSRSSAPDDAFFRKPWVVADKRNNALQIIAVNDAAVAVGLEIGMPLANARAICPDIDVFDADAAADTQALVHIADWCDRFTPLVALDLPYGLFLDISGCAHLFGGEAAMLSLVCRLLSRQGFIVNAAIAGTPACARALTRAVPGRIAPDGEEAATVAPLPVFALGVEDTITRGLRRAGLKTIGDVASRAPREIAARFGQAFTDLLREVLGQCDAPINPRRPPPDFIAEQHFPDPVATEETIAATLSGLAQKLVAAMERQGKGARRLEASFFRADGAVRTVVVDAGHAATRANMIDRLFRERLDALMDPLDPGFGFDLIRLSASRVDTVVQEQRDLDVHTQDNDDVAALIDRMTARLGRQQVVVYLPQDTHIPERAMRIVPVQQHLPQALSAQWPQRYEGEPPLRPLRMFERPEPIFVIADFPHGPPAHFNWRRARHRIARVEGPERIAPEWWNLATGMNPAKNREARARDYFRVEDSEGCRFWLYREGLYRREVFEFRWFMQGVFA
ncbi:DNA polymerase Y family protein [Afipia carboxidovorans]|uniref:DNA polymerase Y family protein n=1 Tax=Afipia carboxidovorans TaxID=40137 RepID=UPI001FCA5B73|nr:DNA polymerase Y family protein [Afipia carboxidovorans]